MLNENDGSTPTSEYEQERDLYNLRNDYIQKLNIVRKRLNLMEINDNSTNSTYRGGCQITELLEETNSKEESEHNANTKIEGKNDHAEIRADYLLPMKCDNASKANSNIFDTDYAPPKKKTCHREKTPRLISSAESSIAYYTKISLNDNLFKDSCQAEEKTHHYTDTWRNKFTTNQEIQCSLETITYPVDQIDETEDQKTACSETNTNVKDNEIKNLFPEVIVRNIPCESMSSISAAEDSSNEENEKMDLVKGQLENPETNYVIQLTEIYHRVTTPPKPSLKTQICQNSDINLNHPNFVAESSEEYYNTGSTSTTTIIEDKSPDRKNTKNSFYASNQSSLWEDLKKFHNGRLYGGSEQGEKQYLANKHYKEKQSSQGNNNRTKGFGKSRIIKGRRKNIPFGTRVLVDGTAPRYLEHKYYYFSSDTDYHSSVFGSSVSARDQESISSCWSSLLNWFLSIFRKHKSSNK